MSLVNCDLGDGNGWKVWSNVFDLYQDIVRLVPRGENAEWQRLMDEGGRESGALVEWVFGNRQRSLEHEGFNLSFGARDGNTARPTCRACRGRHLVQYCDEAIGRGFCFRCEVVGHLDWNCPVRLAAVPGDSASAGISSTVLSVDVGASERDVPLFIKLANRDSLWPDFEPPWTAVGLNGRRAKLILATSVPFSVIFVRKAKELKLPWQREKWMKQLEISCLGGMVDVVGEMLVDVDFGAVEHEHRVLVADDVTLAEDFDGVLGMDFFGLFGDVRFMPRQKKVVVYHQLAPGKVQNTKLWLRRVSDAKLANWQYIKKGDAVLSGPIRHL